MFQLQFFLLHCDEWDRVVALPRHKFVTLQLRFPPPIKLTAMLSITEILLKVTLNTITLKAYRLSELICFFILKVANIRCFILIAVEIFHNIIRK